ncbi:Serine/arginine repetitive matrix protein 1 [Coemansia aciculifera]|nr:Serine/arginine repetitive matrix protein 1 [Coemansia aciculifera]
MSGAFFRGTNLAQDQRFGDATQKLISQTTFSSVLKKRVDMSKVNMEVIKPWISRKINELLGIEDEVLFEYVVNLLQESNTPDGKAMQVNLTGFLESKTVEFMQSLWTLLLEAQKGLGGVPESLIRGKVEEVRQQRVEQERIRDRIRTADERNRLLKVETVETETAETETVTVGTAENAEIEIEATETAAVTTAESAVTAENAAIVTETVDTAETGVAAERDRRHHYANAQGVD